MLRNYAANGTTIPAVEIEFVKSSTAGAQLFYEVTLNDVIIAAIKSGGALSENGLTEELTINYGSVAWRYVSQAGDDTSGGSGGVTIGDIDDDGFTVSQGDCNDLDASVYPDAAEICDRKDNDCDNQTDEGFTDLAAECFAGIGECEAAGVVECTADGTATQCSAVAGDPVAEICDGLDNDCDGEIDNNCCPDVNDLAARAKSGKVSLTWTHVGADSYNVYRSETPGGPYDQIANTASTYATYLDVAVTDGTTYYYRIGSVCNAIEGGTSGEASAMPSARVRR